ncbi:MAG: DJ-1 family protein, partial [Alloprevotella sp.]
TCYPGSDEELEGSYPTPEMVVEDGHIITGRGPGAAAEFAFAIAGRFVAPHVIRQLREDMILN